MWVFYLFWFFVLGIVWFGDLFVGFGRCWGFCFGHGVVDCRGGMSMFTLGECLVMDLV